MSPQLPLALQLRHAPALEDFIVGQNRAVLEALRQALDDTEGSLLYLSGPPGSGRSHLLQGQCGAAERHGLRCAYLPLAGRSDLDPAMLDGLETLDLIAVDDVESIAGDRDWERGLFGLFNRCRERHTHLLFSADRGPAALPISLPDLRSRLAWGLTLVLQPLDDTGRQALLQSLAARRALDMPDDVARYLLDRLPRHPEALNDTVTRLDLASLAEQRRLTIPFVRRSLDL